MNLREKLGLHLCLRIDPFLVMNQSLFKHCFPEMATPEDHSTYFDEISQLNILIDNATPEDRIDIIDSKDNYLQKEEGSDDLLIPNVESK